MQQTQSNNNNESLIKIVGTWIAIITGIISIIGAFIGTFYWFNSFNNIPIDKAKKLMNNLEYAYNTTIKYKNMYKDHVEDKDYEKTVMEKFDNIVSKQYKKDIATHILYQGDSYNTTKYEYEFKFDNIEVDKSIIKVEPTMEVKEISSGKVTSTPLPPRDYKVKYNLLKREFKIIEKID